MLLTKKGKCEFCHKQLVVMVTKSGSVLPVEVQEGRVYTNDDVFNSAVDKSHLLNCKQQAEAWVVKKKKFIKTILPGISPKELHR